jgi:hypothetical protein
LKDELASKVREAVRLALKRKQRKVGELADAMGIDERTLLRHLSDAETLARQTAFELVIGCKAALNVVLPVVLLAELYADEITPAIIIFPGESERLADVLATEAAQMLGLPTRTAGRLKKRFLEFLIPYERFNKTALGREVHDVIFQIESEHGKAFRQRLHEIRYASHFSADGKTYAAPSLVGLIKRAAAKGRRK